MATFIVDAAIIFPYYFLTPVLRAPRNTVLCIIILGIFCTRPILPSELEYNTIQMLKVQVVGEENNKKYTNNISGKYTIIMKLKNS